MTYDLHKISMDQKAACINEAGNIIPVYESDYAIKYANWYNQIEDTPWIPCADETTSVKKAKLYQETYGIISQQYSDEICSGFLCDDLEHYSGRIRIELYQ